jgi:ABC-type branched-subunit amino acid transport system substrate-binding protein
MLKTLKRALLLAAIPCVVLGAASGAQAQEVKFGLMVGFSGDMAPWAPALNNAAVLAAEEINADGGVLGQPLKLISEDNASTAAGGVRGAQKLVSVDNVTAIIGPESDPIMALTAFAKDSKVPIISSSAGTEALDTAGGTGKFIYRTNASDSFLGVVHAKLILDEMKQKDVVVVVENSEGTLSGANTFIRNFEKMGGTVVKKVVLAPGQSSYLNEIKEVAGANPTMVFLAVGQTTGVNFTKQAYQRGYEWKYWVTAELQSDDFVKAAGVEVAKGAINPVSSQVEGAPGWERFSAAYEKRFGEKPQSGFYQAETYDAVILAALAAQAAGDASGASIDAKLLDVSQGGKKVYSYAEGVAALKAGEDIDYEGASGPLDFSATGNVAVPAARLLQVNDKGEWITLRTVDTAGYPTN